MKRSIVLPGVLPRGAKTVGALSVQTKSQLQFIVSIAAKIIKQSVSNDNLALNSCSDDIFLVPFFLKSLLDEKY